MIELSNIEIDAVSGGLVSWQLIVTIGNMLLDFGTGFIDGVNAASGN